MFETILDYLEEKGDNIMMDNKEDLIVTSVVTGVTLLAVAGVKAGFKKLNEKIEESKFYKETVVPYNKECAEKRKERKEEIKKEKERRRQEREKSYKDLEEENEITNEEELFDDSYYDTIKEEEDSKEPISEETKKAIENEKLNGEPDDEDEEYDESEDETEDDDSEEEDEDLSVEEMLKRAEEFAVTRKKLTDEVILKRVFDGVKEDGKESVKNFMNSTSFKGNKIPSNAVIAGGKSKFINTVNDIINQITENNETVKLLNKSINMNEVKENGFFTKYIDEEKMTYYLKVDILTPDSFSLCVVDISLGICDYVYYLYDGNKYINIEQDSYEIEF